VCALVNKMAQLYKCEGRDDLRPDVNGFNLILKACSHSLAMYDKDDFAELGNNHPIAIATRFATLYNEQRILFDGNLIRWPHQANVHVDVIPRIQDFHTFWSVDD
jgi:hypothetical protein